MPLVVFNSTGKKMGDRGHPATPTPAVKVTLGESSQQYLCLIQPRGMRRRQQDLDARLQLREEVRCLITRMAWPIVHNQINPFRPAIGMQQPPHGRPKVGAIVFVQTFIPHPPIIEGEPDQPIDGAVT